jgi:hypothetical protein
MIHKVRSRFRTGFLLPVLLTASSICMLAQSVQGTISGTVYGPDAKPLAGTTVWANIVSPVSRPVDRNSGVPVLTTVSATDGSYTLSNVPPGDYVVCARNAAVAALNPCAWGGAPLVQIATGRLNMSGEAIRMAAGATLQVHLDDPGGFLAANAAKPGASLLLGLATPHGFMPLPITASTGNSRDYKLLVPFNTTHSVMISTRYFKLSDAAGAPFSAASQTIPVTIPAGTQASVINLRIVGAGN